MKNSSNLQKKSAAFTLIEVLVAMAIFSMAAVGLLSSMTNYQMRQVGSSQKTIAHWVAMNRVAEIRIQKKWPNLGITRGSSEMANTTWYWLQKVSKTTEEELRQVEVEIRLNQDDEIATTRFVAFVANKNIK